MNPSLRADAERGQAMVVFAFAIVALLTLVALVVDVGILYGQRRLDQNGADAAAMAAARVLTDSIADAQDTPAGVYFDVTESELYAQVRRYAGLDPDNFNSTASTGINQSETLVPRTRLAVSMEIWDGSGWCYSPYGPAPVGGGTSCAGWRYSGSFPPAPEENRPYKVRVTVNSTTIAFFPIAAITDPSACVRPAGAAGSLGCAHATVIIQGPCPPCAITYVD